MNLDGAKILVTGGCGLIGSTTIDQLLANENPGEIVIFDNLVRGSMRNVEKILQDPRVRLVKGDIRDRAATEADETGFYRRQRSRSACLRSLLLCLGSPRDGSPPNHTAAS